MNCPKGCPQPLAMMERHGVEIDYCPTCRGVWLDRGELDKIIERAGESDQRPRAENAPPIPQSPRYRQDDYDDDHRDPYRKKKKKGFLSEFFDFD